MSKTAKRVMATVGVPLCVAAAAWICGYDFDSRGLLQAWLFLMCVLYMGWQWFAPWWGND